MRNPVLGFVFGSCTVTGDVSHARGGRGCGTPQPRNSASGPGLRSTATPATRRAGENSQRSTNMSLVFSHSRSHAPRGNAAPDAPRPDSRRGASKTAFPRGALVIPEKMRACIFWAIRHKELRRGHSPTESPISPKATCRNWRPPNNLRSACTHLFRYDKRGAWEREKLVLGFVFLLIASASGIADDAPLSLADLESYRLALSSKPDSSARLVGFRDLWDHPEAHTGRTIRIEGRMARLFRQPRVGEFPPLIEAWVVSPAGDPFCLIFPREAGRSTPAVGAEVGFSGTFLRRVKYHGGDADRLAPLIVGPTAPSTSSPAPEVVGRSWSSTDWMMAVGALSVVAAVLASRHLGRPDPMPTSYDPPPTFVDGGRETESDEDEEGGAHEVA